MPYNKKRLADLIVKNIESEFQLRFYSHNLVNTIKINQSAKGNVQIEIPAQIYDILLYKQKKVIVYTSNNSYAEAVNKQGGFSGTHTGYIEKCINRAINQWIQESNIVNYKIR